MKPDISGEILLASAFDRPLDIHADALSADPTLARDAR